MSIKTGRALKRSESLFRLVFVSVNYLILYVPIYILELEIEMERHVIDLREPLSFIRM